MALDLNDPELEFADLVTAYQSWVMAVINDEKLGGDKLLTDHIADDALMVGIAVLALSSNRLTEGTGRWLKLISGVVMVALALLLLLRPGWLF